jgi:Mrp family chromosome partitioning ATPase
MLFHSDILKIQENLVGIKKKILILSGKGGVGKSTVATQLARALALNEDLDIGILDVDLCGPSVPKMMGVEGEKMHTSQLGLSPVFTGNYASVGDEKLDNISVVSIGFLLEDPNSAVIWRGNRKNGMLKQFMRDVHWDRCDFLLVDTPPGTSDEHLSLVSLCKPIDGAILVTTPQEISWQDVRKELDFCRKVSIPIIGLVINMTEFICPNCHQSSEIFQDSGDVDTWTAKRGIPILARIPLDPRIGFSLDLGRTFLRDFPESPAAKAYLQLSESIEAYFANKN